MLQVFYWIIVEGGVHASKCTQNGYKKFTIIQNKSLNKISMFVVSKPIFTYFMCRLYQIAEETTAHALNRLSYVF